MSKGRMNKIEPECNLMQHIQGINPEALERMPEI